MPDQQGVACLITANWWVGTAVPPPRKAICVQHQHLAVCQTGTGPLKYRKPTHLQDFTAQIFSRLSCAWPLTEIVIPEHLSEGLSVAPLPVPIDIFFLSRCFTPRFAENVSSLCNVQFSCGYSKEIPTCRLASKLKEK